MADDPKTTPWTAIALAFFAFVQACFGIAVGAGWHPWERSVPDSGRVASARSATTFYGADFLSVKARYPLTLDLCVRKLDLGLQDNAIRPANFEKSTEFAAFTIGYVDGSTGYIICLPRRKAFLIGAYGPSEAGPIVDDLKRIVRLSLPDAMNTTTQ